MAKCDTEGCETTAYNICYAKKELCWRCTPCMYKCNCYGCTRRREERDPAGGMKDRDYIFCPHCKNIYETIWGDDQPLPSDIDVDQVLCCNSCSKEFSVEFNITVKYTTKARDA